MEEIRLCLVDFNDKEFTAKQVSWKVGTLGAWVQLDLNYVFAQMNNMAAGVTPMQQPMMQPGMQYMMQPGMQPMIQPGIQPMMFNRQMPVPMQISMDEQTIALDQNLNANKVYNPASVNGNFRPTKI